MYANRVSFEVVKISMQKNLIVDDHLNDTKTKKDKLIYQ